MTKAELIKDVCKRTGCRKQTVEDVIEAAFDSIQTALSNGDFVQIKGFGRFDTKVVKERRRIDPYRNTLVLVPEKKVPSFKAYGKLIDAVKKYGGAQDVREI